MTHLDYDVSSTSTNIHSPHELAYNEQDASQPEPVWFFLYLFYLESGYFMVLYCYTPFVLTSVVNYLKLLVVINLFIIRNRFTLLVISQLQPKTTLKIQEFQQAKIRLNPQSMNIPHQVLKNRIVTKILRKKSIKIVNYEISLETGLLNSTSQEMLLLLS